ncbi:ATP synthase subunit f, mitochondrial [Monodelphis domestica]|uniref:ATP synthase subunit f, mitochondrial n=1 Tax=Monodelphis domestica TaxID=13616 RepID=UPI00044324B3|nr:ATP synthase subunit f, mitochondrial [Monodelphis domestica]
MGSNVPLKEQRLLNIRLEQVPAWIMKRDFSPTGIINAFRRGYDAYFNKYIDVKKGGIGGVTMVLAGYILFSYCAAYKELKHERRRKYH